MDQVFEEQPTMESASNISYIFYPITFTLQFLAAYGWYLVGAGITSGYVYSKLRPLYIKWKQAKEDAEYHKDPDKTLARMEAIQRAREKQQEMLLLASQRAVEQQKEREEQKRLENAERLRKYGSSAEGQRLGGPDAGYLPLSGGASTSSYRPPKKSKCGGGGCGR